jgi:hypothetical protein
MVRKSSVYVIKSCDINYIDTSIHKDLVLNSLVEYAPKCNKPRQAIEETILSIHGLKTFHKDLYALNEIEIYIGRSSQKNILSRWKAHFKLKKHDYAAVLFKCDPNYVEDLELFSIKIIKKLDQENSLCVRKIHNIKTKKTGPKPNLNDNSVVYMTWRYKDGEKETKKPGIQLIRRIANETYKEVKEEQNNVFLKSFQKKQITEGMLKLKNFEHKNKLEFYFDAFNIKLEKKPQQNIYYLIKKFH